MKLNRLTNSVFYLDGGTNIGVIKEASDMLGLEIKNVSRYHLLNLAWLPVRAHGEGKGKVVSCWE